MNDPGTAIWATDRPGPAVGLDRKGADGLPFYRQFRAILEGVVLLVVLIAIERLFLGRSAYAGFDVHPFWLPVLLVTMQHGLYGGVITACIAALMLDWPIRPPGLDIVDYYFELVRLPVQWLLVAMAIGIFRQGQIRADEARVREIARLLEVNDRFAEEVARLDEDLWRFEMNAAIATPAPGSPSGTAPATITVAETLTRLAALRLARPADLGDCFLACAKAVLGDAGVRLFRATPQGGYIDISGGEPIPALAAELPPGHAVVRAALAGKAPRPQRAQGLDVVAIGLTPAPGTAPIGLVAAALDTRDRPGVAREEGLRILADAATAGLVNAGFGSIDTSRSGGMHS